MRLRQLYLIAILFLANQALAQKNLLRYLATQKGSFELHLVNDKTKLVPTPTDVTCSNSRHDYMVNNGNLYLQMNGTGKLFQIDSSLGVNRLDNTCFEGYNFGSYSFIRNNKFYNMNNELEEDEPGGNTVVAPTS